MIDMSFKFLTEERHCSRHFTYSYSGISKNSVRVDPFCSSIFYEYGIVESYVWCLFRHGNIVMSSIGKVLMKPLSHRETASSDPAHCPNLHDLYLNEMQCEGLLIVFSLSRTLFHLILPSSSLQNNPMVFFHHHTTTRSVRNNSC